MVEQKPDRRTYGKRQDGHGNIPQRRYLCTKEQTASVRLCVVQCVGNNMNVNIGGGGDQLFGESRSSEQPLRLALLCPITIFVTSESLTYSEICSATFSPCVITISRRAFARAVCSAKSGLILIIYDRIRLHIDGGKSCMKNLSHLCGGVYDPCIGR